MLTRRAGCTPPPGALGGVDAQRTPEQYEEKFISYIADILWSITWFVLGGKVEPGSVRMHLVQVLATVDEVEKG